MRKVLLIGNPNSGKSSLFNHLTGIFQKIANYPGVTTEKKSGIFQLEHEKIEVIDLPGCYSLYPNSIDERVVISELVLSSCDFVIFVADASNLQRSLLLFTQISDCKIPIIMVVNMMDELKRKGEEIDLLFLEKEIGAPVFVCNSKRGEGVDELKSFIETHSISSNPKFFGQSDMFENESEEAYLKYREWHTYVLNAKPNAIIENTKRAEIIDRYNKIEKILQLCIRKSAKSFRESRRTERLDQYLLHPMGGFVFLIFILFIVFQVLFTIASYPMDWLDTMFGNVSDYAIQFSSNQWLNKFLAEAIIPGIAGVLIFIPQIALLFLMNTILEESGYMARIVFLMDRFMRNFGMSGKSILPLLSGNACAIPAIASTKAIPTEKERILTIMSIPFMTCSARLPVYTLLISVAIPLRYQGLTLLSLYLLAIGSAFLFSYILSKRIHTEEKSFLIMELPPYRFPSFKNIILNIKNAVFPFVKTAGKFIFTISIVLWFFASFQIEDSKIKASTNIETSMIASLGHALEPVIKPLGYDWKIGVALLSSFAAREVFVSTLATLYQINSEETGTIIQRIKNQVNPQTLEPIFNLATVVSLLLFYVFALQCMSTLAAIRRETGTWKYALFSFSIMFLLAYSFSFVAFQILK